MFRLENVVKTYTRRGTTVTAFQCTELSIAAGDYVAILGPSGSGKTTLLSLLGGMLSPSAGQLRLDGHAIYDLSAAQRAKLRGDLLGFVFQTFNLIPYLTAIENVQVPLSLAGISPADQQNRAAEILG